MAIRDDDAVARFVDIASGVFREAVVQFDDATRQSLLELDFVIRGRIADRVRREFSGDSIYIRKGVEVQRARRNEAIRADRDTGLSLLALARKHRLGKSQVRNILMDRD